jgi:hypothetical protein
MSYCVLQYLHATRKGGCGNLLLHAQPHPRRGRVFLNAQQPKARTHHSCLTRHWPSCTPVVDLIGRSRQLTTSAVIFAPACGLTRRASSSRKETALHRHRAGQWERVGQRLARIASGTRDHGASMGETTWEDPRKTARHCGHFPRSRSKPSVRIPTRLRCAVYLTLATGKVSVATHKGRSISETCPPAGPCCPCSRTGTAQQKPPKPYPMSV